MRSGFATVLWQWRVERLQDLCRCGAGSVRFAGANSLLGRLPRLRFGVRWQGPWRRALDWGSAWLFPEICQICQGQSAVPSDGYVCGDCWQRLRFLRHPFCGQCGLPYEGAVESVFRCGNCRDRDWAFDGARAALVANRMGLELIHQYKYGGALWLEPLLARVLWDQLGFLGLREGWDCVVPIPLYPVKQRERSFNQAERLGRQVAQRLGVPLHTRLVKRVAPTGSQTMLGRSQRLANMQGAFDVSRSSQPASLSGQRVLVIDDVLTTGATADACARVVRRLGAREIWVMTVARGL